MRLQILWAYEGEPHMRHFEGEESIKSMRALRIDAGQYEISMDGKSLQAGPGQWILYATARRRETFSEDCRLISLDFKAHWPDEDPLYRVAPPVLFPVGCHRRWERGIADVFRCVRDIDPGDVKRLPDAPAGIRKFQQLSRAADGLLLGLMQVMDALAIPAQRPRGDLRVAEAMQHVERSLRQPGFSEQGLADHMGLSRGHLVRLFVAETGMTPATFRQQLRMRQARRLLIASKQSTKQIAYQLGFKQPSHFTNWFKRLNGFPPSNYRHMTPKRDDAI